MDSAKSLFSEVKSKYKYNFVVMTLIFIAAMIACSAEYFKLFSSLISRDLLFYGVVIFTIYLYIIWLPSYLVPRLTSAFSLIVIVLGILASVFTVSRTLYQFIFEIVMLLLVYLYSILRYRRIGRKLTKITPDDTLMQNYNNYKQYELNVIAMITNCVAIFAIVYSGVSLITVVFSCFSVIVVVVSAYRRMFKFHLDSSSGWAFIIEMIGLITAYLLLFMFMSQQYESSFYLLIIIPLLPHWINSLRIWRELSAVLFHQ